MKKKLNEGLFDSIVGGIMTWATKRDIAKDPEFQKFLKNNSAKIAELSKSLEADIADIERITGKKADRY
jgi:anaerobic C4-dicarboxylate transporter